MTAVLLYDVGCDYAKVNDPALRRKHYEHDVHVHANDWPNHDMAFHRRCTPFPGWYE